MNSIKMQVHVGSDGILRVEAPVGIRDAECEVMVIWSRKPAHDQAEWELFGAASQPMIRQNGKPFLTRLTAHLLMTR
jgi:hypothetical protein